MKLIRSMTGKYTKWTVGIPNEDVMVLEWAPGDELEMEVQGDVLVVRRARAE